MSLVSEVLGRVEAEQRDLTDKLKRLDEFLKSPASATLSPEHRGLMYAQAHLMGAYSIVLYDRLLLLRRGML